jgi:hypothetical protein
MRSSCLISLVVSLKAPGSRLQAVHQCTTAVPEFALKEALAAKMSKLERPKYARLAEHAQVCLVSHVEYSSISWLQSYVYVWRHMHR